MYIKRINEDLNLNKNTHPSFTDTEKYKLKQYGFDIQNGFSASGDYKDLIVSIRKTGHDYYRCKINRNGETVWNHISSTLQGLLSYIKGRIDDYIDEMESYEKGSKIKRFFTFKPEFEVDDRDVGYW